MHFYTADECKTWLEGVGRSLPSTENGDVRHVSPYPQQAGRVRFLSHWIAQDAFEHYRHPVLLWVTQHGIWDDRENWHRYYKLRQSYGDRRTLDEAPGHLFLNYEAEDLASFIQLTMLNGWDGYVLPQIKAVDVFFSHDECFEFYAEGEGKLEDVRKVFPSRDGQSPD